MVLSVTLDYHHSFYCIHYGASDHFGEFQHIFSTLKPIQYSSGSWIVMAAFSGNHRRSGRPNRDVSDPRNRFDHAGMMISHSIGIFNAA